MTVNVGELEASLGLDVTEFEESLARATEKLETFTEKVRIAHQELKAFREVVNDS